MLDITDFINFGKRGNAKLQITDDYNLVYHKRKYDSDSGELTDQEVESVTSLNDMSQVVKTSFETVLNLIDLINKFPILIEYIFDSEITLGLISEINKQLSDMSNDISQYMINSNTLTCGGTMIDETTIQSTL